MISCNLLHLIIFVHLANQRYLSLWTRLCVFICRHIRIIINLSAKLVKRKQTTKCYHSFFYTYNQNNQFYAVKMHKMKTNEAIHLVTEYPIHLITECPILITLGYPILMTLGYPVLMTLGYPVLMT